ncbi:hypothetical protein IQ267_11650 [filamentous cyanobacterium LEGE 07170]|nr:hypothetical protein [filamentous cyanobacterium LEGE 07170]
MGVLQHKPLNMPEDRASGAIANQVQSLREAGSTHPPSYQCHSNLGAIANRRCWLRV